MNNADTAAFVTPLDRELEARLLAVIDAKAKPLGALGRIEALAVQIGLITQSLQPDLGRPALLVFAGDHGIVAEGVTAYPSEVSGLIAQMVLDGKAGANIAAKAAGARVFLVDAGLQTPLEPHPALIAKSVRCATRNSLHESAMTESEYLGAFQAGHGVATSLKSEGFGILALGEIGIGNTSAAALVASCVTGLPLPKLVGPGAGAPPGGLSHKCEVLSRARARVPAAAGIAAMREFGGFEMAMMMGAMFGGANARQIVIVDGFIATAAACAAVAIEPNIRDYFLFAHLSPEAGHAALLDWLQAKPLLDLSMRLGEGTGAALAIPLVRMAEGLLTTMAFLPGAHPS
jgi:nicotinate-nucleotide--dimethylbenzimidazole phosphoribosyltransferase